VLVCVCLISVIAAVSTPFPCQYTVNGLTYDLSPLYQPTTDYKYTSGSFTFFINFCAETNTKSCSPLNGVCLSASSSFYSSGDAQQAIPARLANASQSGFTLTYPGGSSCQQTNRKSVFSFICDPSTAFNIVSFSENPTCAYQFLVRSSHACATGQCRYTKDCSAKQYCNVPLGQCGGSGVCQEVPPSCPASQPVCGCDGKVYPNPCMAYYSNTSLASYGDSCATCRDNFGCSTPDYYCRLINCGKGLCTKVPEICSTVSDPVCTCSGKTYPNPCFAASAMDSISHSGRC